MVSKVTGLIGGQIPNVNPQTWYDIATRNYGKRNQYLENFLPNGFWTFWLCTVD